jgi:carbon monoxide dehydrogenase subunit G
MKKAILFTLLGLILLLVGIGYSLPSKWKVERSIVIDRPPQAIYPLVADFKKGWPQWSSFDLQDPTIQYTYSGPDQGIGASRSWVSQKMGNGSQTLIAADPATGVGFELRMARNDFFLNGRIAFEPAGAGTKVTWTDTGDVGGKVFIRYMTVMMDKMMGPAFEKSLANLKSRSEATNN